MRKEGRTSRVRLDSGKPILQVAIIMILNTKNGEIIGKKKTDVRVDLNKRKTANGQNATKRQR